MKALIEILILSILLPSCASTPTGPPTPEQYGVMSFGRDTYQAVGAMRNQGAVIKANKFCAALKLQLMPVRSSESTAYGWRGTRIYQKFVFRCLAADDPEFRRPNW